MSEERTEQVSTYVTPVVKDQLKNEARQEGIPLSKYVRQLLERARLEDTEEQLARDLNAEEHLLELIAEGKDEIAAMTDQVQRQNQQVVNVLAKTGSYSVVNFELLKAAHEPPEQQVSDWFNTASNRLGTDPSATSNPHGAAASVDPSTTSDGGDGGSVEGGQETDDNEEAASFVDELS